jgi:DinB superfamily
MPSLSSSRSLLLRRQTQLRDLLADPARFADAISLFLPQHAALHSARMAQTGEWSFEDAVLDDLSPDQLRRLPPVKASGEVPHSLAWLVWHMTRCEDITLNRLVAGQPQVLLREGWLARLNTAARDTANAMTPAEVAEFSRQVDLEALRQYRLAVGRSTQQIARSLQPADLKRKVLPERMRQIWDEGAVVEAAHVVPDYWAKRDVAGLLLMPATRHLLSHWNEALAYKSKLS